MASINGWVFVLVGAFISLFSYFFIDDMWIFLVLGVAFVAYGAAKLIIQRTKTKDEKSVSLNQAQNPEQARHNYYQDYLREKNRRQGEKGGYPGPQSQHNQYNGYKNSQAPPQHHTTAQHAGHYPQGGQYAQPQHIQHAHHSQGSGHSHPQYAQHGALCRKCGNQVRLHDNFCSFCGTSQK